MDRDKAVFQIATRKPSRTALIGAAVALLPVAVAQAQTPGDTPGPLLQGPQSVESYSLPPGPSNNSAQERLQGPVDPETPLAKPTIAPPSTGPAPSQRTSQPDSQSTAPVPVKSSGGRTLSQPDRQPDPIPQSPEDPSANTVEASAAQPAPAANEPQQPTAGPDDVDSSPVASPPAPAGESAISGWLLWLVAVLLSVLLGSILLWRKRHARPEQPIAPPLAAEPDAGAVLVPETVTRISEPPSPAPALSVAFQPRSANATLINAVLNFELTLSNPGSDDLSDIRITGTMAQARDHGHRDRALILLPPLAEVAQLRNGESEKVIGEFRIPLNSIDPILFQSQVLFVPMVQISIEFADAAGHRHVQTASFLVGREHQPPRPKMAPFRLDLGPRSFAPLGYRALTTG